MLLFPEFCRKTGLDASTFRMAIDAAPHSVMVPKLIAGKWDGMFGFVNTLIAASIDAGLDPKALLYIEYHDHVPELYGMALMVTKEMATTEPDTVRKLLRAFNRDLADTIFESQAACWALAIWTTPDLRAESSCWSPPKTCHITPRRVSCLIAAFYRL